MPTTVNMGKNRWKSIDVAVENHGSIFIVRPLTGAAKEWVQEYVSKQGYQPYKDAVVVEPRLVTDLVSGMESSGLNVA